MIQDIHPDLLDNSYSEHRPTADSRAMLFRDGKLLAFYDAEGERLQFPCWKDFPQDTQAIYLFAVSGKRFFLVPGTCESPSGYGFYTLHELRALKLRVNADIFAAYTAYHLWKWYETSRFCGACGCETAFHTRERAKVCPKCGNTIYPRINPAVIIGVTNGDKLLLTRYRTGYAHNALIAGFTEIGETLEGTVHREVMEEVGLRVKNVRYFKSQPWGIASDLLAGFYCDVDGDDTIRRDDSELKYAEWVDRRTIELQPSDYSLTNEMMRRFRDGEV